MPVDSIPNKGGKSLHEFSTTSRFICQPDQGAICGLQLLQLTLLSSIDSLKSAQSLVQVLVVLYPDRTEPTLFLCTDLHQAPEEILKRIAARFKIEVTFQYLKEQGVLTHWQCRKEKAVARSATLNTCALSLLILWSLLESSVVQPELCDYWPWYRQKDSISIPDMLRQLKAKSIERTIFITLSPDGFKVKKFRPS